MVSMQYLANSIACFNSFFKLGFLKRQSTAEWHCETVLIQCKNKGPISCTVTGGGGGFHLVLTLGIFLTFGILILVKKISQDKF